MSQVQQVLSFPSWRCDPGFRGQERVHENMDSTSWRRNQPGALISDSTSCSVRRRKVLTLFSLAGGGWDLQQQMERRIVEHPEWEGNHKDHQVKRAWGMGMQVMSLCPGSIRPSNHREHLSVTGNNTEMCLKMTSCLTPVRRNKQGGLDCTSRKGFT